MDKTDNTKQPHIEESPSPYYEEDEINLLDILLVLLKHKKLIYWMVFIAAILAVIISLMLPNIYRSEATLTLRAEDNSNSINGLSALGGIGGIVAGQFGIGGNEGLEKLKITLNSREITKRVVGKYNLMPPLFEDEWDSDTMKWIDEENKPTLQDTYKLILDKLLSITIDKDSSTIKVSFEHEDPDFSKTMVGYYITELSSMLRDEVLLDAGEKKKFFEQQLDAITDSLLREKIYALLAKEIERETFAKAQQYYGFLLIDPPVTPDLDKKVKPKRSVICILSVSLAFFFSLFLAFFVEFTHRIKTDDPERYQSIAKELKFWGKRNE
ncbi:MAG: hypothetical protein KKA35_07920 [Proteobacteria bacterium]|nr:hypothetical protein [Pseudomonadota bacterium]